MRIRQAWWGALVVVAFAAHGQQVVELPGVRASATPEGCVASAEAGGATLSYACLTRMVTADQTPKAPDLSGADVSRRPSNTLGLYNASGLQNRMGPNLGVSAQPYRPKLVYPNPLGR